MTTETLAATVVTILPLLILSGCGGSGDAGLSLEDIPRYPDATERESMSQSMGPMSAGLVQMTTTDSHDEVLDFYTAALEDYDTDIISHDIKGGRQTAISIAQESGSVTVAIQEYVKEGVVSVTHMRVGR